MPVISRFYGIAIKMFYDEHNPPHIHVVYGECLASINIQTQEMMMGDLPPRALKMVQEWTKAHESELLEMWDSKEFRNIQPLV